MKLENILGFRMHSVENQTRAMSPMCSAWLALSPFMIPFQLFTWLLSPRSSLSLPPQNLTFVMWWKQGVLQPDRGLNLSLCPKVGGKQMYFYPNIILFPQKQHRPC